VTGLCFAGAVATYAWYPTRPVPTGLQADRVLVLKSRHKMLLFHDNQEICSYRVALGRSPSGPKASSGDHKTPEGNYFLDRKNPQSGFHLAMHVSYPNSVDRQRAANAGASPGGDIMVHGLKNGFGWLGRLHGLVDWTNGCIAISDAEMDQFWELVPRGTPIEIRP
jgi:murein L,D-transpeptidase YafK